jgi:hypothetical protein
MSPADWLTLALTAPLLVTMLAFARLLAEAYRDRKVLRARLHRLWQLVLDHEAQLAKMQGREPHWGTMPEEEDLWED